MIIFVNPHLQKEYLKMNETIKSANINRIDRINLMTSATDIKQATNNELKIVGACIYNDTNVNTGEVKTVGAIKTADGTIYGFTSKTLIDCTDIFIDALKEGVTEIIATPTQRTSKNGRNFYQFIVKNMVGGE